MHKGWLGQHDVNLKKRLMMNTLEFSKTDTDDVLCVCREIWPLDNSPYPTCKLSVMNLIAQILYICLAHCTFVYIHLTVRGLKRFARYYSKHFPNIKPAKPSGLTQELDPHIFSFSRGELEASGGEITSFIHLTFHWLTTHLYQALMKYRHCPRSWRHKRTWHRPHLQGIFGMVEKTDI